MSLQQMALVFTNSRAENTDRLVLLSLANHAGGDGGDAYPSIATIAREARCGESTVRQALERLKASGEVEELGVSPLRTRTFRLTLPATPAPPRAVSRRTWQGKPSTPAGSAPPQDLHPSAGSAPPQNLRPPADPGAATPQDLRPDPAGSAAEPSHNRPLNRDSPAVGGRARTDSPEADLAEQVRGILQRGIDSLTTDERTKTPTRVAIAEALRRNPRPRDIAVAVAIETRSIAQSQNRAPNIAALYTQKLAASPTEAAA